MIKIEGTVKWFDVKKGFGFIAGDDGQDYFVHVKALANLDSLNQEDRVSFVILETEKGKQAQAVDLIA